MVTSIIVAAAENKAIGKNNQLPWHLPKDLRFFKEVTMGHHIIMGRKTYESIGKALPGRTSVVITHDRNYAAPGITVVHSLKEALEIAEKNGESEAFVIGGAGVINEAIAIADTIYLTEVKTEIPDADVFLEHFDRNNWKEKSRNDHQEDEKHQYAFSFVTLVRK
jgi:dihydrofolate reductase